MPSVLYDFVSVGRLKVADSPVASTSCLKGTSGPVKHELFGHHPHIKNATYSRTQCVPIGCKDTTAIGLCIGCISRSENTDQGTCKEYMIHLQKRDNNIICILDRGEAKGVYRFKICRISQSPGSYLFTNALAISEWISLNRVDKSY